MADVVINYVEIIRAIEKEILGIWYALQESQDENVKKEISNIKNIEVSDEQSFNKKRNEDKVEKGTVYIVVRFSAGSINYGSSVTPISLLVIGTANKVKPTQLLLGVFSSSWTTKLLCQGLDGEEIEDAIQVWNTPDIVTNFNDYDATFRNLFRLSGNIVLGQSSVRIGTLTYYYGNGENDNEKVSIMSFHDGYRASLDSQPFGDTCGFTKSEVNFSTYTFSISTYLLNNHLTADALAIRGFRNRYGGSITSIKSPNDKFKVEIKFTNGFSNLPVDGETASSEDPVLGSDFFGKFKVVDSQIGSEIATIPTLTITFSR